MQLSYGFNNKSKSKTILKKKIYWCKIYLSDIFRTLKSQQITCYTVKAFVLPTKSVLGSYCCLIKSRRDLHGSIAYQPIKAMEINMTGRILNKVCSTIFLAFE